MEEAYPDCWAAMLGSVASEMSCMRASPAGRRSMKRGLNTTAKSISPRRKACSASSGDDRCSVTLKYSEASIWLMMRRVRTSSEGSTTAVRTSFTSVVMAKPKRIICTTGMASRMSIVRRSRKIWQNSLRTNAANCFMILPSSLHVPDAGIPHPSLPPRTAPSRRRGCLRHGFARRP